MGEGARNLSFPKVLLKMCYWSLNYPWNTLAISSFDLCMNTVWGIYLESVRNSRTPKIWEVVKASSLLGNETSTVFVAVYNSAYKCKLNRARIKRNPLLAPYYNCFELVKFSSGCLLRWMKTQLWHHYDVTCCMFTTTCLCCCSASRWWGR